MAEIDWAHVDVTRTHSPFLRDRRIEAYSGIEQLLIDSGTQACCLCGQRISDPLPKIQRAASPLAAQTASLCSVAGSTIY
jgi:hypothetical protein